jgi:hypothetical protein
MANTLGKPHAKTRLVKYLTKRILELKPRKTQLEIASEAGFNATNMMTMIKTGSAKLPLDRVPALARALDTDPSYLFMLAVEQHDPTLARVVKDIFGTVVTQNEVAWLEEIREASNHTDPTLTAKARKAIRGIFGK